MLALPVFALAAAQAQTPAKNPDIFYVRTHVLLSLDPHSIAQFQGTDPLKLDWKQPTVSIQGPNPTPAGAQLEPETLIKVTTCSAQKVPSARGQQPAANEKECKDRETIAGTCDISRGDNEKTSRFTLKYTVAGSSCDGEVVEGHLKGQRVRLSAAHPEFKDPSANRPLSLQEWQQTFGPNVTVATEAPKRGSEAKAGQIEKVSAYKFKFVRETLFDHAHWLSTPQPGKKGTPPQTPQESCVLQKSNAPVEAKIPKNEMFEFKNCYEVASLRDLQLNCQALPAGTSQTQFKLFCSFPLSKGKPAAQLPRITLQKIESLLAPNIKIVRQ